MKKLLFTLIVLGISLSEITAQQITKKYNFGNIQEIEAGFVYEIYVTKGKTSNIEVTYPKEMEHLLDVTHDNYGKLILKSKPIKHSKQSHDKVTVKLQMEDITDIDLSGAARLYITGIYTCNVLDIELSGASKLSKFEVNSKELSLECSGASSIELVGKYKEIDIDASGASKVNITSDSPVNEIETEVSGACKVNLNLDAILYKGEYSSATKINYKGNCNNLVIGASGACNLTLEGSVSNNMDINLTGACKVYATDMIAQNARIQLSHVAIAEITTKENLNMNVGRTSKLIYHGNPANVVDSSAYQNIIKAD